MVAITINGESREIAEGTTISDIVTDMRIAGRYAVELNEEIVPKSHHDNHLLKANDQLEIVQAIGGG